MQIRKKMNIMIGPPVTGSNFFPRPDAYEELINALNDQNVLLIAPRRTGKTSLLYYIKENSPNEITYMVINLEKFREPIEWIEALVGELIKEKKFHKTLSSISKGFYKIVDEYKRIESVNVTGVGGIKLKPAVGRNWQKTANHLLEKLAEQKYPVVFLLDEFSVFINYLAKTDQDVENLLRWFRNWRQNYQSSHVKFLVTGSIGLDSIVKRLGLFDTINDFNSIELPPLSKPQAKKFIEKLAKDNNISISTDIRDKIIELLGICWPYFIQIFLAEIKSWQIREESRVNDDDLKEIYHTKMIGGRRNNYLPHMFLRLKECFDKTDLKIARAVLKNCAINSDGLNYNDLIKLYSSIIKKPQKRNEEQLTYILDVLKHDGYLFETTKGEPRIQFFSNILRDYWKRRVQL